MAEQLNLRNELEKEPEVRLFPSVHLSSDREAELRATASLLAAIHAVSEFGRRIVSLSNRMDLKVNSPATRRFRLSLKRYGVMRRKSLALMGFSP